MDEKLLEIWSQGEMVEIFPFEDEELKPGHQEAIVVYDEMVYHILVAADGQPIRINHTASDADYDFPDNAEDWDDLWDSTIGDGLDDEPDFDWSEEEEE